MKKNKADKKKKKKKPERKNGIIEFSSMLPAVMKTVSEGIVILDKNGEIVFANSGAQKILNLRKSKILGKKYNTPSWKILDTKGRPLPSSKLPFSIVKKQKKPLFDRRHFINPGGKKQILLSINAAPIRGKKRKFLGVAASVTDITGRVETKEQLLEEKNRAQKYLDIAGTIFVVLDREGRVSLINKKGCALLGYKKESSLIGKNWFDEFIPVHNIKKVKKEFHRLVSGEISGEDYYENPVLTKKRGERLILWHNVILRDKKGGITGTLSSGEDITERKNYEEKLSRSEEKYRSLFEAFTDPVFICELNGKKCVLEVNEAACRSLGYTKNELLRLKVGDFDRSFVIDKKKEKKDGEKIKKRKYNIIYGEHIKKDGTRFPVEILGRLIDYGGVPAVLSVVRDITERIKSQKALEESEKKYRGLFENANDAVFLNKLNNDGSAGEFIEANRAAQKMTGKNIKKLRKMTPENITRKESLKDFPRIGKELAEKGSAIYETKIDAGKGRVMEAEINSHLLEQQGGKVVLSILRDITRRKEAERAIRDSEEKFRTLAETTGVGIVMFDKKRRIIYANKYAKKTMRYSEKEFLGKDLISFIHPGFRKHTAERFVKRVAGYKKLPNFELQVLTGNGKYRWFEYRGALVNYEGAPAVLGTFIYIDERKRFEQALAESEEKFRTISEQSAQGVAIIRGNDIKYINNAFSKIHEEAPGELKKKGRPGLLAPIHPDDADKTIREMNEPFSPGKIKKHQFRIITPEGKVKWVESYAKRINYEGGKANFVTVVDITPIKEAQLMLLDTVNELRRSNEELQNFAYVASHDLQEPLRMVSSYVQLLKRRFGDRMGPDADEFIGYAVDGAERMRKLINDLLEYSRIGTKGREFGKVDVNSVMEDVERNLKNVIEKNEAQIIKKNLPVINADEVQMVRLFQNLVSNAIKFAKKGRKPVIKISAEKKGSSRLFAVADNGIGIKKEYFNRIFEIFQSLHGKEEYSGTGIGLTICRKIIERHRGNIWVRSTPGKGTVFYFKIPEK